MLFLAVLWTLVVKSRTHLSALAYPGDDWDAVVIALGQNCPQLQGLDVWRARTLTHAAINALAVHCTVATRDTTLLFTALLITLCVSTCGCGCVLICVYVHLCALG